MTEHLGKRISPLIDHQLDHDARDRALAHLAVCMPCQREVANLRAVKARLTGLRDPVLPDAVTARLLGIAVPPTPSIPATPANRRQADHGRSLPAPTGPAGQPVLREGAGGQRVARRERVARGERTAWGEPGASGEAGAPAEPTVSRGHARRAPFGPGGPPRRPAAGSPARRPASGRPGGGPPAGGSRGRARRPAPRRAGRPRTTLRRTLLGSAALIVLAMTGAAVADGSGGARPGGSVAVPTVTSVVAPGTSTGGSLRLLPVLMPMKVSLRR
ncbi:conserved hypothetical protein [Frankia canadensis]|uniref:Zinc-finger domain-containing protein n=1 Tax=Frankia canadensis TaxID=1836972 RepID=A0A2I2KU88_9ACTN|nr:zf-HC2 domain-containing protein [Frankia canadensis]SNQ49222.1 conserved hypothetical protein [Frankia canadensis]SOU56512.1 conserved hypothetical protein [Frankia canadensis]